MADRRYLIVWLFGVATCLTVPYSTGCKNCTIQPRLPCRLQTFGFNCPPVMSLKGPGPPRQLQATLYNPTGHSASLNISWYPPGDSSIMYLEGFEVTTTYLNFVRNKKRCYRLIIEGANWTMQDIHQQFYLDCIHNILYGADLMITLRSFPRTQCNQPGCGNNYLSTRIRIQEPTSPVTKPRLTTTVLPKRRQSRDLSVASNLRMQVDATGIATTVHFGSSTTEKWPTPDRWVTTITHEVFPDKDGLFKLEVTYTPAPAFYNFNKYEVRLVNLTGRPELVGKILELPSSNTSHVFKRIVPGKYKVSVEPLDPHRGLLCQCICKKSFEPCGLCEESGCVVRETAFEIRGITTYSRITTDAEIATTEVSHKSPGITTYSRITTDAGITTTEVSHKSPDNWVTVITYETTAGVDGLWNLNVSYVPAPPEYNFNTYEMQVVNVSTGHRKLVAKEHLPASVTSKMFARIAPGKYNLTVQPIDPHRGTQCQCVCKKAFVPCAECSESGCVVTVKPIVITGFSETLPKVEATKGPAIPLILGLTLGILPVVVIATVIVFIMKKRHRQKQKGITGSDHSESDAILSDTSPLPRKNVFVIVSCGDKQHQRVAGWFCLLLNGCDCDVHYNLDFSEASSTIRYRIHKADKIIIISSKDAFEKFRKSKTNNLVEDDQFLTCIRILQEMWYEDVSCLGRVALVRFPYTDKNHIIRELLTSGVKDFKLMEDIQTLLCFIHDVETFPTEFESVLGLEGSDFQIAADSYPEADNQDSGVGMEEPPYFVPPAKLPDEQTLTSTQLQETLNNINSLEEGRQAAQLAYRSIHYEIDSICSTDRGLAQINLELCDQATLGSNIPNSLIFQPPSILEGQH